jgi:hypothetical protein
MRTLQRFVCLALLVMAADAHAAGKWTTVAKGTTRWGDLPHQVSLQSNGSIYRMVSRTNGGMVRLGLGLAYARPQSSTTTFRKVQDGVWLPVRGSVWDDYTWMLTFDKAGKPDLTHLAAPNYSRPDYKDLTGQAAQRVLKAPIVKSAAGSYGSTWDLRLHDGNLFHVISGGTIREKPSVIPFKVHDIWLDRLTLTR